MSIHKVAIEESSKKAAALKNQKLRWLSVVSSAYVRHLNAFSLCDCEYDDLLVFLDAGFSTMLAPYTAPVEYECLLLATTLKP